MRSKILIIFVALNVTFAPFLCANVSEDWSFEGAVESIFIQEVNFEDSDFSSFTVHKLLRVIELSLKESHIDQEVVIITDTDKLRLNVTLKNLTLSQALRVLEEAFGVHSRFEGNILYLTKSIYAFKDPVRDFREDLAEGQLYSYSIGNPSKDSMEFDRILEEEYGILTVFHGCCVDSLTVSYAQAYNFQLDQYLKKKHGKDVFLSISNRLEEKKNELNQAEVATPQSSQHSIEENWHELTGEKWNDPSLKNDLVGEWIEISGDPNRILSELSINTDLRLIIIENGNYDFYDNKTYSGEWDTDTGLMRYDLGEGRSMTLAPQFGPNAFLMEAYGLDPSKYSMGQTGRTATYFKRIKSEEQETTPE
jgi:DNA-binding transcriptional ArsR family regulator